MRLLRLSQRMDGACLFAWLRKALRRLSCKVAWLGRHCFCSWMAKTALGMIPLTSQRCFRMPLALRRGLLARLWGCCWISIWGVRLGLSCSLGRLHLLLILLAEPYIVGMMLAEQ